MTAITLLEKLDADALFDWGLLSMKDKMTLEDIIQKAQTFNAIEIIVATDEDESESEDEPEKEKNV
jgi:hypothetical protein